MNPNFPDGLSGPERNFFIVLALYYNGRNIPPAASSF